MKEETLMEVGFSKNEAKVYISLLETGPASATKIAEVSGIHRVNVYDSIEKLKDRGLVGFLHKNGKRVFQASAPEALLNIPKNMDIKIKNILPELQLKHHLSPTRSDVEIFVGGDFRKNKLLEFLELNAEIKEKRDFLAYGMPPYIVDKILGKEWVDAYHLRRQKNKQWMYHIHSYEAKERVKYLNTLPYTKARYVPPEYNQTVETIICGNHIIIVAYPDEPDSRKLVNISINNAQVADAYRKYFWILWEKGKEE